MDIYEHVYVLVDANSVQSVAREFFVNGLRASHSSLHEACEQVVNTCFSQTLMKDSCVVHYLFLTNTVYVHVCESDVLCVDV